jgi:two-component system, NarL family, sensor kinase
MTAAQVALTGVRRPSLAGRLLAPLALLATVAANVVGITWWVAEGQGWLFLLVTADTMTAAVVGWLVVRRRPGNAVGTLLLAHGLAASVILMSPDENSPSWPLVDQLFQGVWVLLYLFIALIGYVFPDGHLPSRFWRRYVAACLAGHLLFWVLAAMDTESFRETHPGTEPPIDVTSVDVPTWLAVVGVVIGLGSVPALLVGAVVCAAHRLRRSEGEERRQLLWFTWAALSIPTGLAFCWLDAWLVGSSGGGLTMVGVLISGSVLPLTIGVALFRSRLFDIELVLSRTVTYGVLTLLVVGTYAAVLVAVRAVVGRGDAAGLVAVGVVAVAILPVHARLRRAVERWVYGDRSEPALALRRLSDRLATTAGPEDVVRTVAVTVAEALRVDRVTVEVDRAGVTGEPREPASVEGPAGAGPVVVPLLHQEERLGRLVVDVPPGRPFTPADGELLEDLARHAAVVVKAVYLDLDLSASRARLVTAREEERRRLRRDLHDGLGPALAAIVLKLDAVGRAAPEARELLAEVRTEARSAIEDIRRLVDDLRPPALDEVGLVNAVRQRAASLSRASAESLVVEVDGPSSPELAAAVEVAAYRIATEAVTNVVRHAGASRCVVTVSVNGALELTVADNGRRPWDSGRVGVGWSSMRDRAAELGGTCEISRRAEGGTLVRAVLPLHPTIQVATGSSRPVTQ